ncbi:MAG: hypothetical protein K1X71_12050 [Pirellulales bacterium]|nr:hypothetical protein [Pirellulales bacterium]
MGYLIGIDEAGYAPNLGPLVIAATVWRVPGNPRQGADLYERLAGVVCRQSARSRDGGSARLPIADSKVLYGSQHGIATLERSVLAMLRLARQRPRDCRDFWRLVAPACRDYLDAVPWHLGFNPCLPLEADRRELAQIAPVLKDGFRDARVRLTQVRAVTVFPERFNALVEQYGSKGEALSRLSIQLLSDAIAGCGPGEVLAVGDKHGGRNTYGRFLQEQFPDSLVAIHGEAAAESVYRLRPLDRRVEVRFRVRGEEHMPVALASMVAKYLRELSMRAFNAFWREQLPDLRATAGYPGDAGRFKSEIASRQMALGIDDAVLWRSR